MTSCQHFHYDYVELGTVTINLVTTVTEVLAYADDRPSCDPATFLWTLAVESNKSKWTIYRTFFEFIEFDSQVHRCVFDRKYSQLQDLKNTNLHETPSLPRITSIVCTADSSPVPSCSNTSTPSALSHAGNNPSKIRNILHTYVERLSELTSSASNVTCFLMLKFLELDSRGNHFVPVEHSQINVPAVAAAIVISEYEAKKHDELSIKIGDIVSVIEMTNLAQGDNIYWKGKLTISKVRPTLRSSHMSLPADDTLTQNHHFVIGYFPSNCVKLFSNKIDCVVDTTMNAKRPLHSQSFINRRSNVWKCRPKMFRSTFWTNPRTKQNTIVFGTDLTEYLNKTGDNVPIVLKACTEVIETHGLVTGVYRQCGIQSNIHKLRWDFDHGIVPNLTDQKILRDIHCVSSLLKQYFRQLPVPLFTYNVYPELVQAFDSDPSERITNVRKAVRQLPPAHYRTAKKLFHHLWWMSTQKHMTDMTDSNLAIVWTPNLFRIPVSEEMNNRLLRGLAVHKSMCNFLIVNANAVFDSEGEYKENHVTLPSFASVNLSPDRQEVHDYEPCEQKYIDVNGGTATLPSGFHTVIDIPYAEKNSSKWKNIFRYSSLEQSIISFWNRRNSEQRRQRLSSFQSVSSTLDCDHTRMKQSTSMFSFLSKNAENIGVNLVRSVRNFSLRRTNAWRNRSTKSDSHEGTFSAKEDFEIVRPPLAHSDEMINNQTSSKKTVSTIESEKNEKSGSSTTNNDQADAQMQNFQVKAKRVMFQSAVQQPQIFFSHETDNELSDDDESLETDVSSAESLPLDVSRYDNVLPQKSPETSLVVKVRPISPPSVYDDVKNMVVPTANHLT